MQVLLFDRVLFLLCLKLFWVRFGDIFEWTVKERIEFEERFGFGEEASGCLVGFCGTWTARTSFDTDFLVSGGILLRKEKITSEA